MPRLGKKTLYLDLDALERLQGALQRLPGRPSLSSYFNEVLPQHARQMELMVETMEGGGLRGLAHYLGSVSRDLIEMDDDVKNTLQEAKNKGTDTKKLSEFVEGTPPKKPRKTKVVKT